MLDLVWLLAAIELNGGLVSRADRYVLTETTCVIESRMLRYALSDKAQKDHRQGSVLVFPREQCDFDPAETLLRIKVPLESLAGRRIQLGSNPLLMSVALLHDNTRLQTHPDYQSQPLAENIPAAAFDLFLGSGLQGSAVTLSRGPSLLAWSSQRTSNGQRYARATIDHLFPQGGLIQVGDLRTTLGPEQRFAELRGLSLTNRAPVLRGDGKAEATLQVPSPARIQFYDRHGTAIYASEILAPGNYQIQGYGASTIPGFLEARLVDINGQIQRIFIPWSADRRVLSAGALEWEVAFGRPRESTQHLSHDQMMTARLHYGLSSQQTIGIRADQFAGQTRLVTEISSRALLGAIGTLAAGQSCADSLCRDLWLIEIRAALGRRSQLMASLGRLTGTDLPTSDQMIGQMSVSGAINSRSSVAFYLSTSRTEDQQEQRSQIASLNFRITPKTHLQAQLRSDRAAGLSSKWFGYVGVSFALPDKQSTVNTSLGLRGQPAANESRQVLTTEITAGRPNPFKPTLSLSQAHDKQDRSQAFLRYPSHYGDASVRADSITQSAAWSASTRLWVTPRGSRFGRVGEDNLVIQDLGIPSVRIHQAGRDVQITNEQGVAFFRQVPPWTEARFTLDPKTIPFDVNLASSQIRIPMASHRAYLVSSRAMVTQAQVWRIAAPEQFALEHYRIAFDRHQRRVFISPDGYVDLQSQDTLPILIHLQSGQWAQCELANKSTSEAGRSAPTAAPFERLLQCQQAPSRDPQTASSLPSQS